MGEKASVPLRAGSALDPPAEEIRRMGQEAVELIARYYESLSDIPVYPDTTAEQVKSLLDERLPEDGEEFDRLLTVFREAIIPASRHDGHPRFFGYIASPGTAATAFADLLASALNANVTSWRSAPAAARIERLTIDWIKEIIGYDSGAEGLFVSGGSMANLSALAAARAAKCPEEALARGLGSLGRKLRLYVSREAHHSIPRAAYLLGLGAANVRVVGVDDDFRLDVRDLSRKVEEDLKDGHQPFFVAATAGTVGTGAVDRLADVAEAAGRFDLWMHVDASYGGFAALAPSARPMLEGMAAADSVALDPHKWLYLPIDCGCVLYRDPATARAAFSHEADYTRILEAGSEDSFAFWDYGPELSRRFRALKVWVMLRHVGTRLLGQSIEKNIVCARHFAGLVDRSEDFEMLAPVGLSIFCFRYVPESLRSRPKDSSGLRDADVERELDELNERILVELQRGGGSYLSNARVRGRFALRGCVMNYRTDEKDMEILLEDARRAARRVLARR